MIDIRTENGSVRCSVLGTIDEVCADTAVIIKAIYDGILDEDNEDTEHAEIRKECADRFKWFAQNSLGKLAFTECDEVSNEMLDEMIAKLTKLRDNIREWLENKDECESEE